MRSYFSSNMSKFANAKKNLETFKLKQIRNIKMNLATLSLQFFFI